MATKSGQQMERKEIPFFDGVNSLVGSNIYKKSELRHAENARSQVIGVIEKRQGIRRLGNEITATANYGLCWFENTGNNGFYRISTVAATTTIYYQAADGTWTALTGNGTGLTAAKTAISFAEENCFIVNGTDANRYITSGGTMIHTGTDLGDSTTQFDITNPAGSTFRYTYDTTGTNPSISSNVEAGDVVHITASNFNAANKGSFIITGVSTNYFDVTNAAGVAETNKTIGTGVLRVNNHLLNAPKAFKINTYKNKLYTADYYVGTTRYKNGIQMSSYPLGVVSLVSGDHAIGVTTIEVTDTKYMDDDDVLEVYRGNSLIATLIVTAKTGTSITVVTTTVAINSADELWVAGTFSGKKVFRWYANAPSGTSVKEYDTFKLSGGQNDRIKMFTNISNVMVIGNNSNIAVWNDYALENFDLGIGCVSDYGYTKSLGALWFVHYTGIYSTSGGVPKLMSAKVQKYIEGATKTGLEAAAAGKKGLSVFFTIGDVTLYNSDGSTDKTLSDVCLEYNIRQENWFVHTDIDATQFATYLASSNPDRLEYSSNSGSYHIYELFNTEKQDGDEIPFRIDLDKITLSKSFEKFCYVHKIIIESERGSGINCFISLDGDPFYQIKGSARKGCTILPVTSKDGDVAQPPRCREISISLRDSTVKLCKVSRIAIIYSQTQEEEELLID